MMESDAVGSRLELSFVQVIAQLGRKGFDYGLCVNS
jgi:hypothetical protein